MVPGQEFNSDNLIWSLILNHLDRGKVSSALSGQ